MNTGLPRQLTDSLPDLKRRQINLNRRYRQHVGERIHGVDRWPDRDDTTHCGERACGDLNENRGGVHRRDALARFPAAIGNWRADLIVSARLWQFVQSLAWSSRMRSLVIASLVLATSAATAQEASGPRTVEVRLSNFDFSPQIIQLRAGEPVALHLVNTGKGRHNFSAPQFFASATGMSGAVRNGTVDVAGRQSVDVRVTPVRGTYRLRCTRPFHTAFGMRGQIVVG